MKLSIIIVNYNVKYFLRQALLSVFKSDVNFEYEVFVVDNASDDGSVQMLMQEFPSVTTIANPDNRGFSKANNQAIRVSNGDYILLLNPDTIIEEDTLQKIVTYMDADAEVGGLGVYMIDGKGEYLPESKRGFPTPKTAFYKLFGLSKIFPQNKKFGKYHLSYLNPYEIHSVDVLSGAFMLLRKKVLNEIGLLDEDYFMYGEDIDLSYRIKKAGYKNIYLPTTKIIHFKGESTKKGSLNYIKVFYEAMIIFAQKHFGRSNASMMTIFLRLAIYIRAAIALIQGATKKFIVLLADLFSICMGLSLSQFVMQEIVHKGENFSYPNSLLFVNYPLYIMIWLLSLYYSGAYDRPYSMLKSMLGIISGTILIGFVYGFLPMSLRSSRGIILATTLWNITASGIIRYVFSAKNREYLHKQIGVVGTISEYEYIKQYLNDIHSQDNLVGCISISTEENNAIQSLGNIDRLHKIIHAYSIDEVIFCRQKLSSSEIIKNIQDLPSSISCKIASEDLLHIIGSKSKNSQGEIYTFDFNFNIKKPYYLRFKRLQDIIISIFFLIFLPILIFFQKNKGQFILNIFEVLLGKKYWVGFHQDLPFSYKNIRGILCPIDTSNLSKSQQEQLLIEYAKNYTPYDDLRIIFLSIQELGC